MLFRSQNGEVIINPSKCISISIWPNKVGGYWILVKLSDSEGDGDLLGEYKDYESAQNAMNFIQNNNNSAYRNVRGHWELIENCSENIIIDMPTQEWIDNITKEDKNGN